MAFGCAVAIHLAAIAIAENRTKFVSPNVTPLGDEVIGTLDPPPSAPEEPDMVLPQEPVPLVADEDEFPEENVKPQPIRPRKKVVAPVVRSVGAGTARGIQTGSVKALTLFAPRPNYPYEARRSGITGSGIVQLTVNSEGGNVIEAHMAQSTGNAILNKETVETLRRWRFKPGVASNIDVPITYTLTGVSY
jgi:protein TonB